jgi:uncharacterized Rmd1/YagE family protein
MSDRRIVAVDAYGFAGTLRPKDAPQLLGRGSVVKATKTFAVVRLDGAAWAVIHDFGAVVFFGQTTAECETSLEHILRTLALEPHPPLHESFIVEIDPTATPRVEFDRIVVPEIEAPVVELLGLVLAQSIAMDYYDEDVSGLSKRVDELARQMQARGRLTGSSNEATRFVGDILVTRNQIVLTLSLLDAPPLTWEDARWDRLYRELRVAFEIEDRFRTLEHKLRLIQSNLEIFVDVVQHRRSVKLEWIVIALIAFEIVMAIFEARGRR